MILSKYLDISEIEREIETNVIKHHRPDKRRCL